VVVELGGDVLAGLGTVQLVVAGDGHRLFAESAELAVLVVVVLAGLDGHAVPPLGLASPWWGTPMVVAMGQCINPNPVEIPVDFSVDNSAPDNGTVPHCGTNNCSHEQLFAPRPPPLTGRRPRRGPVPPGNDSAH
jgi:hypothetical protein